MEPKIFKFLLLIAVLVQYVGVSGRRHDNNAFRSNKHRRRELIVGPSSNNYDMAITAQSQNNTMVTAQVGGTAHIRCYTHIHGDEVVTWLKKDGDTILTAGGQVYSSETRYSVAHVRHQRIWELSIREVKLTDAGLYECQLATHPFTSYFFNLKVVEARAVIFGGPEIHIHTGNQLRLQCSVEHATEPPVYIFWFHNNSMVNYEAKRPLEVIVSHHYSSTLVISNVTWCDAGSYRCEPHNAVPSNVTVHVVEGEKQAALYKGQKESGSSDSGTASSSSASITITCRVAVVMQLLITAYGSYWIRILHSLQGAASDNEASVL